MEKVDYQGSSSSTTPLTFAESEQAMDSAMETAPTSKSTSWLTKMYNNLSQSRRIFCLLCLFDFLFTFFLWIIYAQGVAIGGLSDSLSSEVKDFGISSSLFDLVVLSLVRVIILLWVYGIFVASKVYAVAITTMVSTIYLIVKAFVFDFDDTRKESGHRPVDYFLHIGSFILCWAEAWYLQVKVFPKERKALLPKTKKADYRASYGTVKPPSSAYSVLSFHTPPEQDSGDEEEVIRANLEYMEKGRKITTKSLTFLYAEKFWHVEKRKDDLLIESTSDESLGKLIRLRAVINAHLGIVHKMIFGELENMLKWNPAMTQIEEVQKINSTTNITYSYMAEAAGGLVSARDYVTVNHYQRIGEMYLSATTSVTSPLKPPLEGVVRGETPLNCYALSPTADPDKSEFVWITTSALKPSSIPQVILDRTMPGFLVECVNLLKKQCEVLKNNASTAV